MIINNEVEPVKFNDELLPESYIDKVDPFL